MSSTTKRELCSGRVVHLTSVHPPFDVRVFHKECKSITRAGYDVTLIASHDRDETVDGIRVRAVRRPAGRLSRMFLTTSAILQSAIREDADLYHFHDPELIPVGLLLRLKGKIVVYDAHEDVRSDVAFKHYISRPFRRPLAWFIDRIESVSSRYFSACVAATGPISRRFTGRNARTVVISNYPRDHEPPGLHKSWGERTCAVAYTGHLSEYRCIREIVRAMGLLPEKMPATLILAGAFSPATLSSDVAEIEGWDRVRMLGTIGLAQVAQLLSEVRAGLVLFRPDPNSLECAPNKLFEYMQAGIPVIASDFPGFRQVVNETGCGLLVNPQDPRAIAGAVEYILNHPQDAEQMGLRGREAVKARFNWAAEERKLLNLYATLFDSRRTAQTGTFRSAAARVERRAMPGAQE
jgi:glycosyltransferase involved in cell wall biosynthesis